MPSVCCSAGGCQGGGAVVCWRMQRFLLEGAERGRRRGKRRISLAGRGSQQQTGWPGGVQPTTRSAPLAQLGRLLRLGRGRCRNVVAGGSTLLERHTPPPPPPPPRQQPRRHRRLPACASTCLWEAPFTWPSAGSMPSITPTKERRRTPAGIAAPALSHRCPWPYNPRSDSSVTAGSRSATQSSGPGARRQGPGGQSPASDARTEGLAKGASCTRNQGSPRLPACAHQATLGTWAGLRLHASASVQLPGSTTRWRFG